MERNNTDETQGEGSTQSTPTDSPKKLMSVDSKPTKEQIEDKPPSKSKNQPEKSVTQCDQATSESGEKRNNKPMDSEKSGDHSAEEKRTESTNQSEKSVTQCDQATSESGEKRDKTHVDSGKADSAEVKRNERTIMSGDSKPTKEQMEDKQPSKRNNKPMDSEKSGDHSAEEKRTESKNQPEKSVTQCDQATSESGEKRDKTPVDSGKADSAEVKRNESYKRSESSKNSTESADVTPGGSEKTQRLVSVCADQHPLADIPSDKASDRSTIQAVKSLQTNSSQTGRTKELLHSTDDTALLAEIQKRLEYEENIELLNKRLETAAKENDQLCKEYQALLAKDLKSQERLCVVESEAEVKQRRISVLETSISEKHAQEKISQKSQNEMRKKIEKLEAKRREDENNARKREEKHREQTANKDNEIQMKSRAIKDLEKKISANKVYIGKLQDRLKDTEVQTAETDKLHKDKIQELNKLVEDERQNFKALSWQYNQLVQQNKDLSEELRQVNKEKFDVEHEKQSLLLRLSKLAGANLTLNNPNIADLSDEKRPTKLAEEFSELYDNEWTDAFENLPIEDEKEKVTVMLKLLEHANRLCNELSTEHKRKIRDSFCTVTFRETVPDVEDTHEKSGPCIKEVVVITNDRTSDIAVQTETCDGHAADENLRTVKNQTYEQESRQEESATPNMATEVRQETTDVAAVSVKGTSSHDVLKTNEEDDTTNLNKDRDTENGSKGNRENRGTDNVGIESNVDRDIRNECQDPVACYDDDGHIETNDVEGSVRYLNLFDGGNEGATNKYKRQGIGGKNIFNAEKLDIVPGETTDVRNESSLGVNLSSKERSDIGFKGTVDNDKDSHKEREISVEGITGANEENEGTSESSNGGVTHDNERNIGDNGKEDGDGSKIEASVKGTKEVPDEGTTRVGSEGDSQCSKAGHVTAGHMEVSGLDIHSGPKYTDDANDDNTNVDSSVRKTKRKIKTDFEEKLGNEQKKTIMEVGKFFEAELSGDVEKVGTEIILKEQGLDYHLESLAAYVTKCMNICWSMCRHVPPVHVDFPDLTEDISFDTNKYKPYTKSGKYVQYIVWPAVYLHTGGAMLCKGVAQGKK